MDGSTFQCSECGASLLVERGHRSATCPYCRCPSIVERPATPDRPAPRFVLPFTVTSERARDMVTRWTRRTRMFHRALDDATIAEIKGVYVPACFYSCVVRADYTAQIGENYTVTETYTTTVNGKTVTRVRTRTVTEWRSLAGEHEGYMTDLIVSASSGLPNAEIEAIEPFDLRGLRRYADPLVSGWIVEEPSVPSEECLRMAREEARAAEERRLRAFMPGDSHNDLRYTMTVDNEAIDPALVPVWVLAVRPDPKLPAMRVVVNGQTAEVWGPEKLSALKIVLWILLGLVAIALVAWLASGAHL